MALSPRQIRESHALWAERTPRYRRNWLSKSKADPRRAYWLAKYKVARDTLAKREKQLAALAKPVAYPAPKTTQDTWDWHPGVHDGVDLICPEGSPLVAICDGVVIDVRSAGWWGKGAQGSPGHPISDGDGIVQIRCTVTAGPFKPGLVFAYGHAEHANVRVGQKVKAGQQIAKAGWANAPHTHFMVHDQTEGTRGVGDRDPRPFLDYAKAHGTR